MEEQFPIKMMNEDDTKNWTKVGLSFYQAKDVLVHIVEAEWTKHHTRPNQKPASETDIYYLLKYINDNKEVYTDREFQKAARKVRDDRNDYIHQLPKAKVTDQQLEKWTGDMLCLLKLVETPELAGTASQAMERIEKILKADYRIVLEDENKARLSYLEGKIGQLEHTIQKHGEELQSIRNCFSTSDYSSEDMEAGEMIKRRIDKVEANLMERLSTLESTVDEVKDQQTDLQEQVDDLRSRDPKNIERQEALEYIEKLKTDVTWNHKSEQARSSLIYAANNDKNILFDLLIEEGVTLTMKDLPCIGSAKGLRLVISYLKKIGTWNSEDSSAIEALECAKLYQKADLEDVLKSNGVSVSQGGEWD